MDFEVAQIAPVFAIVGVAMAIGWVINTWLRIKHGYPLESSSGQAIHPKVDRETMERIKLLTSENAQLRAEVGSLKDRLENVERIVTDEPSRLEREIDSLALDKRGNA